MSRKVERDQPDLAGTLRPVFIAGAAYTESLLHPLTSAAGSALRRRESSVEEGSTRIIVDRSGSWRAAWAGAAAAEQGFVDAVMQDRSEVIAIFTAEITPTGLSESVADHVGVAAKPIA